MLYSFLLIPGYACFALYAILVDDSDEELEDIDDDLRQSENAEFAAEASRPDVSGNLWSTGFSTLLQASTIPVVFLTVGFGLLYFYYLYDAYFDGNIWEFSTLLDVVWRFLEKATPQALVITIVLVIIVGAMGLWRVFISWRQIQVQADIDRDLTDAELNLIKDCMHRLEQYVKAMQTSILLKSFSWLFMLAFFGVSIGGIIFLFTKEFGLGGIWYIPERTAGLDWFIYRDGLGAADFLVILDIILAVCFVWAWLAKRFKDYQEYSVVEAKTQNRKDLDPLGDLREDIALDVRKRLITRLSDFDASEYLQWKYRSYEKWINVIFVSCLILTLPFWFLDRRAYELFTPEYIEHVGYWTGEKTRIAYEDTSAVNIACYLDEKDNISLEYKLVFQDTTKLALVNVSNRRELKQHVLPVLQEWSIIDAKMRAANIIRYYGEGSKTSRYTPQACNKEIAEQLSSSAALE